MSASPPVSHAVLSQAADWFALLRSGDASDQDRQALQRWLAADEDHRRSWRYVESVAQCFDTAAGAGAQQAEQTIERVRLGRASRRKVFTGLAVLVGVGTLTWRYPQLAGELSRSVAAWRAQYRTATGEIKELVLRDGSRVWMGSDTALDTDFRGATRQLVLRRGEVLIETGKADSRALLVRTTHGTLQPLGTRFSVRDDGDSAVLAVFEGRVQVRTKALQRLIDAGYQVCYGAGGIGSPRPADRARQAWRRGVLLADDIRLADLILELQRYRPGIISVSPAAADLRVFGGYPLTDSDRALAMLEQALPIRVRHTLPWWVGIDLAE